MTGSTHPWLAPRAPAGLEPGPTPTFSVVIAAYDVADLISTAVDSALAQTMPPLEVVVCDDGSTDDLEGALARYGDRVRLLRKEHGGEASAKNAAARAAQGDYVAILDADDVYLETRLQALAELAAARPDLDVLTSDAYLELDGRRIRRCYEGAWTFEVEDQRSAILQRNFIFGLVAVRRSVFVDNGGFDEAIYWATDWDLWSRLILGGSKAGVVDEPLALYRLRETSLSARRANLVQGRLQVLEKAAAHPSLSEAEVETVAAATAAQRRELAAIELRHALVARERDARRRATAAARDTSLPPRVRLKAACAALAPRVVGAVIRRRSGPSWTAAGGVRVDRDG
jgi:hypothetical protein